MLFNAGFIFRSLDRINECTYDPPNVINGSRPMWMQGAQNKVLVGQASALATTAASQGKLGMCIF